jgi:hypothetical protein
MLSFKGVVRIMLTLLSVVYPYLFLLLQPRVIRYSDDLTIVDSRIGEIDITRIYSISDMLPPPPMIQTRPFRAPHHTVSHARLVGGGSVPRPGRRTPPREGPPGCPGSSAGSRPPPPSPAPLSPR